MVKFHVKKVKLSIIWNRESIYGVLTFSFLFPHVKTSTCTTCKSFLSFFSVAAIPWFQRIPELELWLVHLASETKKESALLNRIVLAIDGQMGRRPDPTYPPT